MSQGLIAKWGQRIIQTRESTRTEAGGDPEHKPTTRSHPAASMVWRLPPGRRDEITVSYRDTASAPRMEIAEGRRRPASCRGFTRRPATSRSVELRADAMMVMPVTMTVMPGMGHRRDGGENDGRGHGRGKSKLHGYPHSERLAAMRFQRGQPRLYRPRQLEALD